MTHPGRPALRLIEGNRSTSDPRAAARACHPSRWRPRPPALYIGGEAGQRDLPTHIAAHGQAVTLLSSPRGRSGLEMARERRPRLVVVEGYLPDCDAERLVKALRRVAMPPPAPIAVLAHEGTPSERARFLWAGASAYLSHPLSRTQMSRMVGVLIEVAARR